jgi:phosphatidylglycerol:prolipoprotein diacylglycerol transferase
MFVVSISPIILSLGHLHLRWYSLIVGIALLVGVWLADREVKRKGFDEETFFNIALWIVLAGIIGARLFHVIDHWSDRFAANPLQALYIWDGGLAIWGAVIGGLIAVALFARHYHWKLTRLLDAIVPGVVLAQAIGRVACIITGDSVGKPTSGPFGIAYTNPMAMAPKLGVYYVPTPIYEIGMNLAIFALVCSLRKKNLPDGVLTLIYFILYSIGRFVITTWSAYQPAAFGLNQAQIIGIIALVISTPLLIYTLRKDKNSPLTGQTA